MGLRDEMGGKRAGVEWIEEMMRRMLVVEPGKRATMKELVDMMNTKLEAVVPKDWKSTE